MTASSYRSGGWRSALQKPFEFFDRVLDVVERTILVSAIMAMAIVSMINVISRNMGASVSWADEVAQLLVVVVTFVGLGHGVRMARHIRVSAIHDVLPPKGQKILIMFISLTTGALLFFLGVLATDYVTNLMRSGRVVPSLGIPVYYIYIIAPIGLFIGSVQYFLAFVRNVVSPEAWLSWHHKDEYAEEDEDDQVGGSMTPEEPGSADGAETPRGGSQHG
ncbi:TRAP transporter small permease [Hydrocarboniclastica marina]|uniref:TRAP transporter small permease protein n=1 Tax=Hydrocarboniclastica marina TaxID=2259620 RepID=A0A4P7XJX0_9ALTE|nr:TRAP transporter small permease [Hydrocarboniclastica marina]QCF26682.1 TRAP transporter small permease [Hydrocarboniclastica marina]